MEPAVIAHRYRLFLGVAPPILVSWLTIGFLDPDPGSEAYEPFGMGLFLGSLFGHTTLAAAWAALGPGRLVWRMPLSLMWVAMLVVAIALNERFSGGALLLGAGLLGLWLVVQLPLWGLALGLGWHVRHWDDTQSERDPRAAQFSIRELVILMAIVGLVFGVERVIISSLTLRIPFDANDVLLLIIVAGGASSLALPLLFVALQQRLSRRGVILTLVMFIAATACERPLVVGLSSGGLPDAVLFFAVNGFACAVVLVVTMAVRFHGFRLARTGLLTRA
jgi:hypothetical protein